MCPSRRILTVSSLSCTSPLPQKPSWFFLRKLASLCPTARNGLNLLAPKLFCGKTAVECRNIRPSHLTYTPFPKRIPKHLPFCRRMFGNSNSQDKRDFLFLLTSQLTHTENDSLASRSRWSKLPRLYPTTEASSMIRFGS